MLHFKHPCTAARTWYTALVLLIIGIVAGTTIFILSYEPPFIALGGNGYDQPQEIVAQTDEYIDVVAGLKCNISDKTIERVGESVWRRVDVPGDFIDGVSGNRTLAPGECQPGRFFRNPLPDGMAPGVWELVGTETAHWNGKTHTRTWSTTPFIIEAR